MKRKEVPRLSTYLRTFGNVSHPDDKYLDDEEDLIEKKRQSEILQRRLLARRKAEEEGKSENENGFIFGQNLPFNHCLIPPKSTDEEFKLLARPDPSAKFHLKSAINFDYQEPPKPQIVESKYTIEWLEKQLGNRSETGLSGSELSLTIVEFLQSGRSSDDLQTELFDLLGFDKIELIQALFEHRSDLVKSYAANQKVRQREIASIAASLEQEKEHMPTYGLQDMVQYEDERKLKKQVQKEKKRMAKLMKNVQEDSDKDDFDARDILATAMTKPVIKPKERSPGSPYRQGDHVRVIGGLFIGSTGLIVQVLENIIIVLEDLTMHELLVLPSDLAKVQQSTSFAVVASGSSNDSFGMIQTGGTNQGTIA